ncbi:MAG: isoprenylcysteine carboxylmethyltransferase family protein [Pseudomonadota bacterium]
MPKSRAHPLTRLPQLLAGALHPPPGAQRIWLAVLYGLLCHSIFGLAILSMFLAMFFGMSESFGQVRAPFSWGANALLLLQFPLMHSLLLTRRGGRLLSYLAPERHARTLSTTTYALVASVQLLMLFTLWTPSGTVWWRAEGPVFVLVCGACAAAWALLIKAILDAGVEVQSGALGWLSLLQDIAPKFPDMPTHGLFRIIRQPIYVAFALTLWTVPVWTPDQLMVATALTAYCLGAPVLKERRFAGRYGARFAAYRARVPYAVPGWRAR